MNAPSPVSLRLAHGFGFADLYDRDRLAELDGAFCRQLQASDTDLYNRFMEARADPDALGRKFESDLLIELAGHVEDFLGELFGITDELRALAAEHHRLAPVFAARRNFVQRRAAKKIKPEQAAEIDGEKLAAQVCADIGASTTRDEVAFARAVLAWEQDEDAYAEQIERARHYAAWAVHTEAGRAKHAAGVLFVQPRKVDPYHLVPVATEDVDGVRMLAAPPGKRRERYGFGLTDSGADLAHALSEANYCILCHNQGKDSCRTGLTDKKTGAFKESPFGVTLAGCPLEERISEFHTLKIRGQPAGALAMICIDNPLVAATGHRICNDCMKSCIYQKQDPVDIPQAETRTLKDVLSLPWGFEVYSLLTRWNPLDLRRPVPRPASGYSVLVVGTGPAGFNLAHHLLNDGHSVVAVDGLKIEPLADDLVGRTGFRAIRSVEQDLEEPLDARIMAGFGGVAEYGITVRWDKNFLKMVRLLLERRSGFSLYGGVRFGGTLTVEDAYAFGFDHIALAAGAGRPTLVPMTNGLARGVRQASDFLMALQLTGAAKADSLANLQLRLPVVVVGGGLTAIDTATEALAYYPVQVEKFAQRYDILCAERGEAAVRASFSAEDAAVCDEFLAHARAIRAEKDRAAAAGDTPRISELVQGWGGATIVYRRRLVDAPSYTLNHEEVAKAFEEGIRFAELLSPEAVEVDGHGHAEALTAAVQEIDGETGKPRPTGERRRLPARAILIAAGTQPNTVLSREDPAHVQVDGRYFRALDEAGRPVSPQRIAKPDEATVLAHLGADGRAITFFGDLHPSYAGNVVKAMGGAKQGYPVVSRLLAKRAPASTPAAVTRAVRDYLAAQVVEVNRLTPGIVEVIVRCPAAAQKFQPGQFFRLQNYESRAPVVPGSPGEPATRLAMEGLALTGAYTRPERGEISMVALEMGGSSDLCQLLEPGEPVVVMGPTGTPTEIPGGETVCLVGGGLGNAVLLSIGKAMREAGNRVLYFAGYKRLQDRYMVERLEAAADHVVWCCDEAPGFTPRRDSDGAYRGNIVAALHAYARGELASMPAGAPKLSEVDRLITIGSDKMMAAVAEARQSTLAGYLKPGHKAIGSINSPMQCMMKEICAQCLQPHRDPFTGEETVVFSCFNQDQSLDQVRFDSLAERLGQNALPEKLTAQWIDRALKRLGAREEAA